jgi:hypothetical protein
VKGTLNTCRYFPIGRSNILHNIEDKLHFVFFSQLFLCSVLMEQSVYVPFMCITVNQVFRSYGSSAGSPREPLSEKTGKD